MLFRSVLLELTTGRVANDGGLEYCLAEWAWRQYQEYGLSIDLFDESIRDPAYMEDAFAVFTLGVICTGGAALTAAINERCVACSSPI